MNNEVIKIENLSVKFKDFYALKDITLSINQSEIIGIVGGSGSGKTTLCRVIAGIERQFSGVVYVKKTSRISLQFVFQDPSSSLNPRMKIKDIVVEPLMVSGIRDRNFINKKYNEALNMVGIARIDDKYPHQLSGGQKQRVAIARAIISDPEILICDEPISNLDISVSAQILNLLKDLHSEKKFTMIFVSHDISAVYYLATKIVVLYKGEMMEWGDSKEIIKNPGHPYTSILISSILSTQKVNIKFKIKENRSNSKCSFSNICPQYNQNCNLYNNDIIKLNENHFIRCKNYGKDDKNIY